MSAIRIWNPDKLFADFNAIRPAATRANRRLAAIPFDRRLSGYNNVPALD
jgi:hypothetical protein